MKYFNEVPFAVTISDEKGNILEMNDMSKQIFAKYGDLIGKSLFNCHGAHSSDLLHRMLENHNTNVYTIEKEGKKKLIYQSPWFEKDIFKGYIEISFLLPEVMPNHIRNPQT